MLQLHDVTVRYGAATAVRGVSVDVSDGEVLALLGPSGCGKSTLLRAIVGIEPLASGRVAWDGVDLARVPIHRRGFGLMFQDGVLFPHRTVAGNVGYGLGRWDREASAGRVAELLDMVGLAGYGGRRVATLSGGEAQRVALARALAPRPRLLLLDEPLAALDMSLRAALLADLDEVLRSTGTTAVFVTHDQGEAFAIADRVALMRTGRIVQIGTPGEVRESPVDPEAARFLGLTAGVRSD
jgi:thiamine transport system ATP-binding protein